MRTWIDFKKLRQELNFAVVLRHYRIDLKGKGERATGMCPLPTHPQRADGQKRTASFSANTARGIWQCFGCKASGNVLELAARMEGFDPTDPVEFRKAAIKVAETFGVGMDQDSTKFPTHKEPVGAVQSPGPVPSPAAAVLPPTSSMLPLPADGSPPIRMVINEPLKFELKHLNHQHPYLPSRGIRPETIEHFGVGFCAKGLMADRIAIPLHDLVGRLVGYAGRATDDARISDENPKYRFPGTRERDRIQYEFRKNMLLYNAHRISSPVMDLVVVEGFMSVWWLWQAQYRNVVALMGSSCSQEQAEAIIKLVDPAGRVWAFPDGDAAGASCAMSLFTQISPHRFVRWVKLNDGHQPTHCSELNLSFIFERQRERAGNFSKT
jgi:DNA primase